MTTEAMDPSLKFATGIQKGRPLDSVNMPYRIIERNGMEVALFRNGAMARFYRDPIVSPVLSSAPWPADGRTPVILESEVAAQEDPATEEAPRILSAHPHMTIGILLYDAQGRRRFRGWQSKHRLDPAYCILEDGRPIYNVAREVVGTGLREYLWLYETLRGFGRGRLAALAEARSVYFL